MTIADAEQREAALDPTRSFCVSAPAGSGKTGLLIQRYLSLLSRVSRPEQVVAITFTRKAAAEMRQRVVDALIAAQSKQPVGNAHDAVTRSLAERALLADAAGNWELVRDESRLNIKTIDSFCATLTRQMPVLSRFGGPAEVVDDAAALYREAVAGLFAILEREEPPATDLKALLLHFDNNWQQVQALLLAMLRRRDQWGEYVGVRHQPEQAERVLIQTVRAAVAEDLGGLRRALAPWENQLLALQRYAADNLGGHPLPGLPSVEPESLAQWQSIKSLLLTKQGAWRKTVDKRSGFPSGGADARAKKALLVELVEQLSAQPELLDALAALDTLPETGPGARSWQLAVHLAHVLPRLAAELLLVFARHGKVDHGQVALSALDALGDDEAPTELALRLDYLIEHILVDEFQDTAINQFELVRRLTRGWGMHNESNSAAPRTIMIVGDAMQSIYGFRDANVGLFLKAREEGFNGVALEPLALCCNFRSDQGIVSWVNTAFARAFPQRDDSRRGQVSFTPAVAVKPAGHDRAVRTLGFQGDDGAGQEVAFICDQVQNGLADPDCHSIAILGRSRAQLRPLLAALKRRGIAFSAQEMDKLADSPAVVDLLSLCRALANPADRVAWLAALRAPWCGLSLADLHRLAASGGPVPGAIAAAIAAESLPVDSLRRLQRLQGAMNGAARSRDRLGLRVWLEQLWENLGGPATVEEVADLEDVERFFQLLEVADTEGVGLDPRWLAGRLEQLKLSREQPDSKVQVMTLHKAKGLEFDWVFLPGLDRVTRGDDRQLLLWDDYTSASGDRGFLLAADDHAGPTEPTLYNYLGQQRRLKTRLETTRLVYVGATRAGKRLYLSACLRPDGHSDGWRLPPANSLLSHIWETFAQELELHQPGPLRMAPETAGPALLRRLAGSALPAATPPLERASGAGNRPLPGTNRLQRHAGTVVHQTLELLSREQNLPPVVDAHWRRRWRTGLRQLGLCGGTLHRAVELVEHSVNKTLSSERGRWLLAADHVEAHSEWALSCCGPAGEVRELVIDRCFIARDTGERWIIDYKSSQPEEGESMAAFLVAARLAHQPQLRAYRDALVGFGREPLRCALFFTALGRLEELAELRLAARPGPGRTDQRFFMIDRPRD